MTTTSFRAGALTCVLLATTAFCGFAQPAHAQTARQHRALDANGVDLTHGDFLLSLVEGAIGAGDGALALTRVAIGRGDGTFHVSSGGHQWDGIWLTRSPIGSGFRISINKDRRYELFDAPGTLPTGSSLTAVGAEHHYRTADGILIVFGDPTGSDARSSTYCNNAAGQGSCVQLPLGITAPDGTSVGIQWEIWQSCEEIIIDAETEPQCSYWARIASVSNSFGYRIAFEYASNGNSSANGVPPPDTWQRRTRATFHNDALGGGAQAQVSYAYPAGEMVDVTDMAGRAWRFTASGGRVTALRRPGAPADTTSIAYGVDGAVTSVTRDGVTTDYARSVSGNVATTTVTDALARQTLVTSDLTIGRPVAVRDALGHSTAFQYDAFGRLTRTTASDGDHVALTYDARGNVTQTRSVAKPGSPASLADIVTSASYDASCANPVTCNQPNSSTDARNHVTDYSYDPVHGGLLSVTAPAMPNGVRPRTRFGYTLSQGEYRLTSVSACQSQASCIGTGDEVRSSFGYDANGNLTSSASGAGDGSLTAVQAMTYDPKGDPRTVDGPLPGPADTIRYHYSAGREQIGAVSPDPDGAGPLRHRAVRTAIDGRGLVTAVQTGVVDGQTDADWTAFVALETVETDYDANSRPVTSKLVAGSQVHALTQASHDALGRAECMAVRMNPAAFAAPPASACSLGAEGSFGPDRISRSHYDALGRIAGVEVALGTADQAFETRATFTPNGQVETLTDGENNRTTYAYDGFDRLSRTLFPVAAKGADASNPNDHEELTYDPGGNVTARRLRDGQAIGYSYDALSRLTLKDLPGAEPDTSYTHDNLGRMLSAVQGTYALSFSYDALGRKLTENGPNGLVRSHYDLAGRRVRLDYPDAPAGTLGQGFFVTNDYLVTGEMSVVREMGALSGTGVLATFSYDDLGRRVSLTRGNGTTTSYGYDASSRLTSLGNDLAGTSYDVSLTFGHNPAGQIVSTTRSNDLYAVQDHLATSNATSNGLNQLTQSGGATLSYDGRGNLVSDGTNSYTFSAENLLTRSVDPGGSYSESSFTYDPLLRLDRMAAVPVNTGQDSRRTHNGSELLVDSLTLNRTYRYVPGPNADEPLVMFYSHPTIATNRRWYHADERGSILTLTREDGTADHAHRYDEYGNPPPVWQRGSNWGRFQYTGQYWLGEPRLFYYKSRFYDPASGRFLQTDRIGYGDGLNLYAYVGADPVNFSDPFGSCKGANGKYMPAPTGSRICGGHGSASIYGGIASQLSGSTTAGPGGSGGPTFGEAYEAANQRFGSYGRATVNAAASYLAGRGPLAQVETSLPASQAQGIQLACAGPLAGPCAQIIFRALQYTAGVILLNEGSDQRRGSKPVNAPAGTVPIDQAGIGRGQIHDIKRGVRARPNDWVGITPTGHVITTDPIDGRAIDEGHKDDF